jgi:hypothetical protein
MDGYMRDPTGFPSSKPLCRLSPSAVCACVIQSACVRTSCRWNTSGSLLPEVHRLYFDAAIPRNSRPGPCGACRMRLPAPARSSIHCRSSRLQPSLAWIRDQHAMRSSAHRSSRNAPTGWTSGTRRMAASLCLVSQEITETAGPPAVANCRRVVSGDRQTRPRQRRQSPVVQCC